MDVLKYAKPLPVRKETVDLPELGGAVVVRGLMASEAFAVQAFRSQALRRLREEAAERQATPAPAQGPLPDEPGPPGHPPQPDPTDQAAQLTFDELVSYGRYVSHLLAAAVTVASGAPLFSYDGWESFGQHHPRALLRLQAVAERLSGLHAEDVEKN